jgi:hypothetical protein
MSDAMPPPADAGEGRRAPRVRGRAVAVVLLALAVIASGVALDRVGARPASSAPAGPFSGAWFCPHGGGPGWHGWVSITNPGGAPASVRVTSFGSQGPGTPRTFTVAPGAQLYRPVDASDRGSTTEVEYFGAWVGAGSVVESPGSAVAAARCVDAPHPTWLMPDESTGKGETAYLVVMNPFGVPAEFSVTLRTERRSIHPGSLTPEVLGPGRSEAIEIDRYVLEGPGERTVTAQVVSQLGRVVAGSLVVSSGAARAAAGLPAPASRWYIPAGGYGSPAGLVVVNPGSQPAVLSGTTVAQGDLATLGPSAGTTLTGNRAVTIPAVGTLGGGIILKARGHATVGAAFQVTGPAGDAAAITGASDTAMSWLVPPSVPDSGGSSTIVLLNPGSKAARVRIRLLGESGEVLSSFGVIDVPAGREALVPVSVAGTVPVAAVATAAGGGIVAGGFATSGAGAGYAATVGLPIPAPRPAP